MAKRVTGYRSRPYVVSFAVAVGLVALLIMLVGQPQDAAAQEITPTGTAVTPAATPTASGTPTPTRPSAANTTATATEAGTTIQLLTTTATVTATATATPTLTTGADVTTTVTPTPTQSTAGGTPSPTAGPPVVEFIETEVLTGTIFANRTDASITFFLEGRLYQLPPRRSTGVMMQRALSALTLYNCETGRDDQEQDCFWDPYPIRQDGFYEIVNAVAEEAPISLLLQEAVPPPNQQIWIQNRTGHSEEFLFRNSLYQLDNSTVLELALTDGEESGSSDQENLPQDVVYLRRCLGLAEKSVCEWLPQDVIGGIYYALIDETVIDAVPDSALTTIRIEPVLAQMEDPLALAQTAPPTPEPTPEVTAVQCRIQVPTLNIRSGPGLDYLVIGKVQTADQSAGAVRVVGRTVENDWLAVEEVLVPGGWVIHADNFLLCDQATDSLPITSITDGRRPIATPAPSPADPQNEVAAESSAEETAAEEDAQEIPAGRALLIATNAFEHDIRFTLSAQQHGLPEDAPSEYDLKPGQSVELLIRAGRVQFSASSPFKASSGNDEFILEEGQTRELFLHFTASDNDSEHWELRYQ